MMTINQIAAMAAAVACGMRFGEFEPAHRDVLVARTKDTIDNGKPPEYTCEDILGTEDASRTFDKITQMLGRFVQESKLVDVVAEKALAMGIENAIAAMSMAQRLFGGERAEVIDADLMALVEACLPVALPGESIFDTAVRVLNEYAFMKGLSGALVRSRHGRNPVPVQFGPMFERYSLPRTYEEFVERLKELRLDDLRAIGNDLPISNLHEIDKADLAAAIERLFFPQIDTDEMITVEIEPSEPEIVGKPKKAR